MKPSATRLIRDDEARYRFLEQAQGVIEDQAILVDVGAVVGARGGIAGQDTEVFQGTDP